MKAFFFDRYQFLWKGKDGARVEIRDGTKGNINGYQTNSLVEPPLNLVTQVLSPNGGQRPQTTWGLNVTNNTDDDHWWGLDDGDSLDDFTLVHLWRRGKFSYAVSIRKFFDREVGKQNALDPGRSKSRTTWVIPAL